MTTSTKPKEAIFLKALESLFVGAKVEGESGFVNLMRVKYGYFQSLGPRLLERINGRIAKDDPDRPGTREELFDKLYSFFRRYFCDSGSIYFRHTPVFSKTYESVYEDGRDVALSWKTRMLYYVKSDVLLQSMPVELESASGGAKRFYFDATRANGKKNNEKKEFVFSFLEAKKPANGESGRVVHLAVSYSRNGAKTNMEDIVKAANKDRRTISMGDLQNAIAVFRRQTEVDFFINKDARGFLREQFDLWMYQYLFSGETVFEPRRLRQLQAIRDTAYDIIDFIAQFEGELVKVWNKPKFVKNAHYVITLDRIEAALAQKIKKHKGYADQAKEWRDLGIDKDNPKAPIDTRFFKDLEIDILAQFDDLDESLDGWLIKSENYQALNTILPKFQGKVQTAYIDPPFNTGDDFPYMDKFQDSTWLSLMNDRIKISAEFLSAEGNYLLHLDKNANQLGKVLINENFGLGIANEIIWDKGFRGTESKNIFQNSHDTVFFVKMSDNSVWNQPSQEYKDMNLARYNQMEEDGRKYALVKRKRTDGTVYYGKTYPKEEGKSANDVISYVPTMASTNKQRWNHFQTQKPEELIQIFIEATSNVKGVVLDFFGGSGTTLAVAHKSGRKWVGVEIEDYFEDVVLSRMKEVLAVQGNHEPCGISKDVGWQGGGFFKYYELEQYEETLSSARYSDGEQLELDSAKSPFEQYVFFADDKLSHVAERLKNGELKINLGGLYADIDIAESLSHAAGKAIKRITRDSVIFADDSEVKTDPARMSAAERQRFIAMIKPYLWWGEE